MVRIIGTCEAENEEPQKGTNEQNKGVNNSLASTLTALSGSEV